MENKILDTSLFDGLNECPTGGIAEAVINASAKMRRYDRIMVCVSGGKDSDYVVDILATLDKDLYGGRKCRYVNIDPGLEYKATKEHLDELEEMYSIKIIRLHPKKTVAQVAKYAQPFCNKQASEYISRLQKHGFAFENHYEDTLDTLLSLYPNCQSALEWFTNQKGEGSRLNIDWNKDLKSFLCKYPPYFDIGRECCVESKEKPMNEYTKKYGFDLIVTGIRKAEGGTRSVSFSSCFTDNSSRGEADEFRPLFFLKKEDLTAYEQARKVIHSKCYKPKPDVTEAQTESASIGYGLKRTGCAACPFGQNCLEELEVCREYEPNLYKVTAGVFRDSITYTSMYRSYKDNLGHIPDELLKEYEENRKSYERRIIQKKWRQYSILDNI